MRAARAISIEEDFTVENKLFLKRIWEGVVVSGWLLSRNEISIGAKVTYAVLAEEVSKSGVDKINL
ncbi:MAG: hypothetical protein LC747_08565, partial [Acidobacteria bacterium]|nr:hypothetical protein [Acidobacteriota bacterium]